MGADKEVNCLLFALALNGNPQRSQVRVGEPLPVVAPLLWFLNFAAQNLPSERRKNLLQIKPVLLLPPADAGTRRFLSAVSEPFGTD